MALVGVGPWATPSTVTEHHPELAVTKMRPNFPDRADATGRESTLMLGGSSEASAAGARCGVTASTAVGGGNDGAATGAGAIRRATSATMPMAATAMTAPSPMKRATGGGRMTVIAVLCGSFAHGELKADGGLAAGEGVGGDERCTPGGCEGCFGG